MLLIIINFQFTRAAKTGYFWPASGFWNPSGSDSKLKIFFIKSGSDKKVRLRYIAFIN